MFPNLTIFKIPKIAAACPEFMSLNHDNSLVGRSVGGELFLDPNYASQVKRSLVRVQRVHTLSRGAVASYK